MNELECPVCGSLIEISDDIPEDSLEYCSNCDAELEYYNNQLNEADY